MSLPVRVSSKESALQVSKSRKLPVLINLEEMEALLASLGTFSIFDVSRPVTVEEMEISPKDFLFHWGRYVEGIVTGKLIDEAPLRPYFSAVFTTTPDALYAIALANGKYLIKAKEPVIQLQRHHFIFSEGFHSGVMGEGSITWGIQFSYPQLYLDPKTNQIGKVIKNSTFPNTELFQKLAKWVRSYTSATPFVFEEKQINEPMRLGKQCFDWINHHPTLKEKQLHVASRKNPQIPH